MYETAEPQGSHFGRQTRQNVLYMGVQIGPPKGGGMAVRPFAELFWTHVETWNFVLRRNYQFQHFVTFIDCCTFFSLLCYHQLTIRTRYCLRTLLHGPRLVLSSKLQYCIRLSVHLSIPLGIYSKWLARGQHRHGQRTFRPCCVSADALICFFYKFHFHFQLIKVSTMKNAGSPFSVAMCYPYPFSALTLLVGWQEGQPACKKSEWWGVGVVICLERDGHLHMAQLMPLPLTVSCFSKIQICFIFLVPTHPGSPGQRPLNGCVCVCVYLFLLLWLSNFSWHWMAYNVLICH